MLVTKVIFVTGPLVGHRFEIPAEGVTVGRSHTAGLTVPDGALSRIHCRIRGGSAPSVQDLGSSNGSLLNGRPLGTDAEPLHDGDVLTFGDCACRVTLQESGSPKEAEGKIPSGPMPAAVPNLFDQAAPASASNAAPAASVFDAAPAASVPNTAPAASISNTAPAVSVSNAVPAVDEVPSAPAPNLFPSEDPPGVSVSADPEKIDLGLSDGEDSEPRRRSPLTGLILALAALVVLVVGVGLVFTLTGKVTEKDVNVRAAAVPKVLPFELRYERLAVDRSKLFRYTLTFEPNGELAVVSDDFGADDRSFSKRKKLTPAAVMTLRKLLMTSGYLDIGELPPQRSADGLSLDRRTLTVVMGTHIWTRTADNADNRVFETLCTRLEEFGEYELELQAARYSVSELQSMGSEQLALAHRYWEQRDLGDDRLFASIMAYRRGLSALDTLNPKPPFAEQLSEGLKEAEAELQKRYDELRFQVDQARNMQRYDLAAEALRTVLRMIPDRDDERNAKASADLVLIETRYLKRR